MNKLTKAALDWHSDGLTDMQVASNVQDEVMYDLLEKYGIELSDKQETKLEMIMRSIILENIDWGVLEQADEEVASYKDAKRSAIYK